MKVIVVGHSPGSSKIKYRSKSATIKRLDMWLGACDVYSYSFVNLYAPSSHSPQKNEINEILLHECLNGYNKIITLGNEVKQYFKKRNIPHFAAPHPSPLNRNLNDKSYEKAVINSLQTYLNDV